MQRTGETDAEKAGHTEIHIRVQGVSRSLENRGEEEDGGGECKDSCICQEDAGEGGLPHVPEEREGSSDGQSTGAGQYYCSVLSFWSISSLFPWIFIQLVFLFILRSSLGLKMNTNNKSEYLKVDINSTFSDYYKRAAKKN